MPDPLLIRADGGVRLGAGHVMRCLALAGAWRDAGGTVTFATHQLAPALAERLVAEDFGVVSLASAPGSPADAAETAALACERHAAWAVVDGYQFGEDYQRELRRAGLRTLFIDDNGHAAHYSADLVLNQNLGASADLYRHREPHTRLLLGSRYVLLRKEFMAWRGRERVAAGVARKILVTLGGADADNVTASVIQALQQLPAQACEAVVVVGAANPHLEKLRSQILRPEIRLIQNATNLPELMAWADLAVSAGGSTCWELAFMGLPGVILVLADNQRASAGALHDAGVAVNLGWHQHVSPDRIAATLMQLLPATAQRAGMLRQGRKLVDGLGALRVIAEMNAAPRLLS